MSRVLTEADAAADLAGLPRAVSTYDVQLMAAKLDDMIANPWSASAMLLVLVSERDALAGRVAELEAQKNEWLSWNEKRAALEVNARRYEWLRAQHWGDNKLGVVLRPMDNTKLGCFIPSLELLDDAIDHMSATLSTTPESKP